MLQFSRIGLLFLPLLTLACALAALAGHTSPVHAQTADSIGITSQHDVVGGGLEPLNLTLTRTGDLTDALTVTVTIAQDEAWLATTSHQVTFTALSATATLVLAKHDFSLAPTQSGDLTATVAPVSGYDVSAASVTVEVVAIAGSPVTIAFDESAYSFHEEGPATDVQIGVVAVLDRAFPRLPSGSYRVSVSTVAGTAGSPGDYRPVSSLVNIRKSDFAADEDGQLVARKPLDLAIVDDDVYEGDEDLTVTITAGPGVQLPPYVSLGPAARVTITDLGDPMPALTAEGFWSELPGQSEYWGEMRLCWTPAGLSVDNDLKQTSLEFRRRMYTGGLAEMHQWGGAPGGTVADFSPWQEAEGTAACNGSQGIGFTDDRVRIGFRYTYQVRAQRAGDDAWQESEEASGVAYNTIWPLRSTIRVLAEVLPDEAMTPQGEFDRVPDPVPESMGSFVAGVCFSRASDLLISCGPVEGFDLAADLAVTNATVALESSDYDGIGGYLVRVTPTVWGQDVTIAVKAGAVSAGGKTSEPTSRSWQTAASGPKTPLQSDSARAVGGSFTAAFENMPSEHDGSAFKFVLRFSEAPARLSYRTMRNRFFEVTGGSVKRAKRLEKGSDLGWRVTVVPDGVDEVQVSYQPTPDCEAAAAVCTGDGRALASGGSVMVPGLVALSVSDAQVQEGPGATLDFAVTLDRAASAEVRVDYATADGTAVAGSDYTAISGTLVFAPGEMEKTVSVPVLDDSVDDSSETLTLTLLNATGARIADGTAIGTIHNSDAIPQAWLARFGRTISEQVLDAVGNRLASAPQPGVSARLAGQRIEAGSAAADGASGDASARRKDIDETEAQARLAAMTAWLRGETGEDSRYRSRTRAVTERDLLTGTSFAMTSETAGGARAALWSRGALTRFDGREDRLSMDGEVATGMVGADWTRGSGADSWTAGLAASHSRGTGGYRGDPGSRSGAGADDGEVVASLTGMYPYGRYALNEQLTLWGVAGYGGGTLTLKPEGQSAMETDIDLTMVGLGLRGVMVEAPPEGGAELMATSDAMWVRTTSASVRTDDGLLGSSEAEVTRLRLGLEGSWRGVTLQGGALVPRLEVGVRHDGGDAETGFGFDLGGGLSWRHGPSGIAAEVSGRGLLTHETQGFRDRGLAGSLTWDPRPETERGPRLALRQSMGAASTGGMDALLGRTTLAGLAANGSGGEDFQNRRLSLKLGYGFPAFSDRFTSIPEIGFGLSDGARDYSLGGRLVLVGQGAGALNLGVEATRREHADDNDTQPEHEVRFRLTAQY